MDVDEEPGIELIQNELNQIERDTVKQYASLVDLQQKRKNLEIQLENKNVELHDVNHLNLELEAEMHYNQMRLIEMEKRQESGEVRVQEVRSEIEILRSQIQEEKSKSELALQLYEKEKSEIMTKLLNAPVLFNQEHMERNVTMLNQNKENFLQEIDKIDHLLQDLSRQLQSTSVQWSSDLNNLDEVCKTMQKRTTFAEQETKKLKRKIEYLTIVVQKLKEKKADKV